MGTTNITTVGTISGPMKVNGTVEVTAGGFKFADGTTMASAVNSYKLSFVNGDLSVGSLTVTHNLNSKTVKVDIYDNNFKIVYPDEVTGTDVNTTTVNLASYGTLTGTWTVVIVR